MSFMQLTYNMYYSIYKCYIIFLLYRKHVFYIIFHFLHGTPSSAGSPLRSIYAHLLHGEPFSTLHNVSPKLALKRRVHIYYTLYRKVEMSMEGLVWNLTTKAVKGDESHFICVPYRVQHYQYCSNVKADNCWYNTLVTKIHLVALHHYEQPFQLPAHISQGHFAVPYYTIVHCNSVRQN